jgi:hypothetical protein
VKVVSQHRKSRETTASHELSDLSDTAFAMALLWVIPVMAFLYALTRL